MGVRCPVNFTTARRGAETVMECGCYRGFFETSDENGNRTCVKCIVHGQMHISHAGGTVARQDPIRSRPSAGWTKLSNRFTEGQMCKAS